MKTFFDQLWDVSKTYSHLLWMGLLVLGSMYFYVERGLFLDAAFILGEIVREEQLAIMVGRYGAVLTQIWPLIGLKLGVGLSTLVFMYSVSFAMIPFLVAWILYRMQQTPLLILLVGYYSLYYTESFFWTNNEIHQAVCIFLLGVGCASRDVKVQVFGFQFWMGILLVGISILTHPLMVVVVSYALVLIWLTGIVPLRNRYGFMLTLIVLFTILVKVYLSTLNWYDAQKLGFVELGLKGELVWFGPNFGAFFRDCILIYWPATLLFIIGLIWNKRHLLTNALAIIAIIAHVLLVSWVVSDFNRFYIESQWMLLSFFVLTPWLMLMKDKHYPRILHFLIILSMINAGWHIGSASSDYSARVSWLVGKVESMNQEGIDKAIIDLSQDEIKLLRMSWGLPSETLLVSGMKSFTHSMTLIDRSYFIKDVKYDQYHNCFDTVSIYRLPSRYFLLSEGPYVELAK
jgi:hypothetical protein